MLTHAETLSMLTAIKAVHGFVQTTPEAVETWRDILGNVTLPAVRDALRIVLQESSDQPTPADILRVIRLQRAAAAPLPAKGSDPIPPRSPEDQAKVDQLVRELRQRFQARN